MKKLLNLLLLIAPAILLAQPSPSTPPTKIAAGAGIVVSTNGVNNFTISAGGTNSALTNLVVRQLNGNALTVNTNVLVVATNYVGMGTATPLRPLHVGNYTAAGPSDTKILISAEMNNANGSGNSHAFADSSLIGRSGNIGYNSFYANANLAGGVDYDHYAAFQSSPANLAVGVMKNYYGHFDVFNMQSGTTKTNTAFYASRAFVYGGTVENNFGLYVEPHTNGTVGNWAVYTDGTTPSTFGGAVKVGQLKFGATAAAAGDAGLSRYAADVLEVNNGTTGQRRDLMLRELWDSGGNKVVGTRQAAVADAAATAGTATLAGWGFVSQAEFDAHIAAVNALKDQLNDLLAKLRTHGLIAP